MTCYPTISDFLQDALGVNIPLPIQTFGFFVAMAFLAGAWMISSQLRQKEKRGLLKGRQLEFTIGLPPNPLHIMMYALIGFALGWKLVPIITQWAEFSQDPQNFIFGKHGSAIGAIIGAGLLALIKWNSDKRAQLPKPETKRVMVMPSDRVGDIVTIGAITGIIGARLMVLLEDGGWQEFFANPGANLFSGLSIYGGLLLGIPCVILYARSKDIDIMHLGDSAAPVMMFTYAIGRMGCQFSGDGDWGRINLTPKPESLSWLPDWLWAFDYPNNVNGWCNFDGSEVCRIGQEVVLSQPVWPTPIYEIVMAIAIGGGMLWLAKRTQIKGLLFGTYFLFSGAERLLIEQLRINTPHPALGGLTQAEAVSLGFILFGVAIMVWAWMRRDSGQPVAA